MGGPAAAAGTDAGKRFGGGFAGGVKKFALIAGAGFAAVGVGLFQVGKTFHEVEKTIRVGTGETGKSLDGLVASAKNIGKNVPSNFGDIGDAVADLNTRLGLTGKPLEDLAGQFLNVSRITGSDLQQNIAGVTRVFGDWGIATEDQAGTLDALFRASQSTGAGFDTLQRQVVQFGAPMRQLGFSFDETLALLGKFEKEGVNTELVMGSMRIALGRMAREGEEPVETFRRITDQIKNAGDAGEANALALELFGARAGPDMAAAIREGRFEIDDLVDTIANGGETIDQASKDTMSFSESWQLFKNRALVVIEPIARRVFDLLGRGMEWLMNTGVPAFGALVDRVRPFASQLADRVVPAVKSFGDFLRGTVIPAVADLGSWLVRNRDVLFTLTAAVLAGLVAWKAYMFVQTVIGAVKALRAAMAALNLTMRANPIGIVITVLAALAAAVVVAYKRSETFRNVVQKVWKAVQDAVKFAWERIIKPALEAVVKYYKWVWEQAVAMKDRVVGAFRAIRDGLSAVWRHIRTNVIQPWVDRFNWVRDKMVQVKDKILATFRSLRDALGRVFRQAIDKIKSPIRSAFKWINKHLIRNLNKVTSRFNLRIDYLPEKFHTGGVIPGRGETMITALGGEGVVSPRGMRTLGKAGLDAINAGNLPFGGPLDWVRENIYDPIARGVSALGSQIGDWLKKGAAFALDKIMGVVIGASGAMPGGFTRDMIVGVLKDLRPRVKEWGAGKDALTDDTAPGSMSPASIAASGWARPIGPGFRIGRGSAAHGYPALDLPAPVGTAIYAAADGPVTQSLDSNVSYGKRVMIGHSIGRGVYAHMSQRLVKHGDYVRAGQVIGRVGSTGNSTGPHLHLELGRHDPLSFLRRQGVKFDRGGTLAPGWNPVFNGTGGPETLRRVGIAHEDLERPTRVEIDITGGDDEMRRMIRKWVRIRGGDVQKALGS